MDLERDLGPSGAGEPAPAKSRADWPTRKSGLHDAEDETHVRSLSPAQRMEMVWQLSLQAWAFKEGLAHEPRLQRDAVRIVRRGR